MAAKISYCREKWVNPFVKSNNKHSPRFASWAMEVGYSVPSILTAHLDIANKNNGNYLGYGVLGIGYGVMGNTHLIMPDIVAYSIRNSDSCGLLLQG